MSTEIQNQEIEFSSESDPEDIDLDQINEIKVETTDLDELDQLFATTKQDLQSRKNVSFQNMDLEKTTMTVQFDAFLRNFFIRNKMNETLENFQQEWFQMKQNVGDVKNVQQIPEEYVKSQKLRDEIRKLRDQLDRAIIVAEKARGTYDKLLKERNFYKMHHQRVQQEKKKLNLELEKLRNNHILEQRNYDVMADKYSSLMKEKMLIKLQRDRLKTRAQIQRQMNQTATPPPEQPTQEDQKKSKTSKSVKSVKNTPFPPDDRINPHAEEEIKPFEYKSTVLYKTSKGHDMTITSLALHPKKPILATCSDDLSWKLYTIPQGELIMSGEGHKDWLSSIKFHPKGLHLFTSSGDGTIKIWDFLNTACIQTFTDHAQSVWDIDIHDLGDFFVSASMDHLAKVFDINVGKCRHSLRGHVDSVNTVRFQPYSNIIASGSADKTVSLWDMKTSLCIQTFYGHSNAINSLAFNIAGDKIASCDSDGIVKMWDVRMVKQKETIDFSEYSANCIGFDVSGNVIGCGLDNGEVKLYNTDLSKFQAILKGHEDAVQDIVFDQKSKAIYTCGADCTYRIWQ